MIGATALIGIMIGFGLAVGKVVWLTYFSRKLMREGYAISWPLYTFALGIVMTLPFWVMTILYNMTGLDFLPAAWVDAIGFIIWTLMVPAFGFLAFGWILIILWAVLVFSYFANRIGDAL